MRDCGRVLDDRRLGFEVDAVLRGFIIGIKELRRN